MMDRKAILSGLTALALLSSAAVVSAGERDERSEAYRGYGPGMMMGPGYGYGPGMMMGPGAMGGYGYGPGMMMGPGAMGGYGYGPGMMGGYGPGMMGPGMMGPGMMGMMQHMMGGPGMMGPGYGYGPGMMMGPGAMGGYGYGPGMMGGGYGPGMMGGGYGPGMMGAFGAIELSDQQRDQMQQIARELRKQQWDLAEQMMEKQDKLQGLYAQGQPNPEEVGQAYAEIAQLRRQMVEAHVQAQNRMQDVLTEEQREQLRSWNRGDAPPRGGRGGMGPGGAMGPGMMQRQ